MKKVFICFIGLLFSTQLVFSHPMPKSILNLYSVDSSWQIKLVLPNDRLKLAMDKAEQRNRAKQDNLQSNLNSTQTVQKIESTSSGFLKDILNEGSVGQYVRERISLSSDGTQWLVELKTCRYSAANHGEWLVSLDLIPPENIKPMGLQINYGVITDEIITHKVEVYFSRAENSKTQLPMLHGRKKRFNVDL